MKVPDALMTFAYWVVGVLTDFYYQVRESPAGRPPGNLLYLGMMALAILVAIVLLCQF